MDAGEEVLEQRLTEAVCEQAYSGTSLIWKKGE